MIHKTEDVVRQEAYIKLELDKEEVGVTQGVGQVTSFKQLGISKGEGLNLKPDGWYLPDNKNKTAIILETKSSDKDIHKDDDLGGLRRYYEVASRDYDKVVSIYYNGKTVRVFKIKSILLTKK